MPAGSGGNLALRRALAERRIRDIDVATSLRVDPKTVHRWLDGRVPQPKHRWALADLADCHEYDLWPELVGISPIGPEVVSTYTHRGAVPRDVWSRLLGGAQAEIGILVYSGLFIAEDVDLLRLLERKASEGVSVRILLGDPDDSHIALRGEEEGIADAMAAKIRNAIVLYRPLHEVAGVEIRLHATVLYNSIYRADDDVLVNPHVYGVAASHAPVLHLRRRKADDLVSTYLDSFDRVWNLAQPLT